MESQSLSLYPFLLLSLSALLECSALLLYLSPVFLYLILSLLSIPPPPSSQSSPGHRGSGSNTGTGPTTGTGSTSQEMLFWRLPEVYRGDQVTRATSTC